MNSSRTLWLPAGNLTPPQRQALAVEANSKPDRSLYLDLLSQRLQSMVDANPQAARAAMEMSREQAPELWELAQYVDPEQWGRGLMQADLMNRWLAAIDWDKPGAGWTPPPATNLREVLETLLG